MRWVVEKKERCFFPVYPKFKKQWGFSALGLAGPVRHPTLHLAVIILIEHSARAHAFTTGELLIAGAGTPG